MTDIGFKCHKRNAKLMEKKTKILQIVPSIDSGGAPFNVLRLAGLMKNMYYQYLVADCRGNLNRVVEFENTFDKVENIEITKISAKSFLKLILFIKKNKPHIVCANGKGAMLYASFAKILLLRFKLVYVLRGFHNPYKSNLKRNIYHILEKIFYKTADAVVCVSNSEFRKYSSFIGKSEKISIIPNYITLPKIKEPDNLFKNKFNIVSISRISFQKDILTMLKVIKKLQDKIDLVLHIYGGVPNNSIEYSKEIYKKIKDMKLEQNVKLLGDVPFAAKFLPYYDLYLSTSKWEGLPTSIIEAQMAGVPVVATNCTGNVDVIEHKKTGMLCKTEDVEELSSNILALYNDKNLYTKIKDQAQAYALNVYSSETISENYIKLFNKLLRQE